MFLKIQNFKLKKLKNVLKIKVKKEKKRKEGSYFL